MASLTNTTHSYSGETKDESGGNELTTPVLWNCAVCTLENESYALACCVCLNPRFGIPDTLSDTELAKSASMGSGGITGGPAGGSAGSEEGWACKLCTSPNESYALACCVCLNPRTGEWNCKACTLKNYENNSNCRACTASK